jgi:hypothetical protein
MEVCGLLKVCPKSITMNLFRRQKDIWKEIGSSSSLFSVMKGLFIFPLALLVEIQKMFEVVKSIVARHNLLIVVALVFYNS